MNFKFLTNFYEQNDISILSLIIIIDILLLY